MKNNKKDFIIDNGKIRNCYSNVAKMSKLEYTRYMIIPNLFNIFDPDFREAWQSFLSVVSFLCWFIIILSFPLSFPVIFFLQSSHHIKEAKKHVNKNMEF